MRTEVLSRTMRFGFDAARPMSITRAIAGRSRQGQLAEPVGEQETNCMTIAARIAAVASQRVSPLVTLRPTPAAVVADTQRPRRAPAIRSKRCEAQ